MTGMATGHEGSMSTVEASLVLSLLYMSEMLFLLVTECTMFSLATLILRFNGQSVYSAPLGFITCAWYSV